MTDPQTRHSCVWSDFRLTSRKKPKPLTWERKTVRCRVCGHRIVRQLLLFDKNGQLIGVTV